MYRLPYFPFPAEKYSAGMDTAPLGEDRLIEIDAAYAEEIALKQSILALDYPYYCHVPPATQELQWEALEILLPHLAKNYHDYFLLKQQANRWAWTNRLLPCSTEMTPGDSSELPLPPLDWIARQVQEDLLLMEETDSGETVLAAE